MRSLAWLLPLAIGALACGKVDDGAPPDDEPVEPGADCTPMGATAPSVDGCNTCTCSQSGWACDEMECPPPVDPCLEGSPKPADDGCRDCTCSEGSWCSATPCTMPACMDGETSGDGCNSCTCSNGEWLCSDVYCPPPCEDGTVKAAGDGCNSCSCEDGEWLCTQKACAEPECIIPEDLPEQSCDDFKLYGRANGTDACCELCYSLVEYTYYESMEACEASKLCAEGETKYADDQCNTCTCSWDGTWACTAADCAPVYCGGLVGGVCTEDEYCAYEAGQGGCGITDASAICRPRPEACTEEEAPVCGCDGETYSNACIAAMLGDWGVMHDGPCEAPPPD